jgi:tetratricopeptide (TPR) repeat protein
MSDSSTITTNFTAAGASVSSNTGRTIATSATTATVRSALQKNGNSVISSEGNSTPYNRWSMMNQQQSSTCLSRIPAPSYENKVYRNAVEEAEDFYTTKLRSNPNMARYNTMMGAITSTKGQVEAADSYFRQAVVTAPNNILTRNDFALHMATHGNYDKKLDAIKEMKKTLLMTDTNPLVHKNIAALYARTGQYQDALRHANESRFLAANDPMNHRNLAKLHSIFGDTHSALEHNLQSIQLEDPSKMTPHTSAYRSAAVQIISKGGSQEEAIAFMKAARMYEKKKIELPTTQRTNEILEKVERQQRDILLHKEREKQLEEERKKKSMGDWQKIVDNVK